MIRFPNHDSNEGEQRGRDQIHPELWLLLIAPK